jgi:hypothetical protein
MNSSCVPAPAEDGRDDGIEENEVRVQVSLGKSNTNKHGGHKHKRSQSLGSSHRDSLDVQRKHHRRPPTGSYTKKGLKRLDGKHRRSSSASSRVDGKHHRSSSVSSRTQIYNAFMASGRVDADSRNHGHFDSIEEDSYGRFVKERQDGAKYSTRSRNKGLKPPKPPTHRRQASSSSRASSGGSSAEREGTPATLKKTVSFHDGGEGGSVTEVRDNALYTEEEKVACFYTERDFRRFRAEHYLGVIYVEEYLEEDDTAKAAARDLLHVVGDMWNSFLDMTFSSIHG